MTLDDFYDFVYSIKEREPWKGDWPREAYQFMLDEPDSVMAGFVWIESPQAVKSEFTDGLMCPFWSTYHDDGHEEGKQVIRSWMDLRKKKEKPIQWI